MNVPLPKRFVRQPHKFQLVGGLLLYLLPLPLALGAMLSLVGGDLYGVIVNTGGYLLYATAATWIGRAGDLARQARLRVSKARPRYRIRAAWLAAVTTALLSWLGAGYSLWVMPAFGLVALGGMYLYYGFDPKICRESAGADDGETAVALEEAETILERIDSANRKIRNREFNRRIERILAVARDILDEIAHDPADVRRARKFLKIYLEGARKVTEGYASTHRYADSTGLEENFRQLLETIESVFRRQHKKLLENDLFDLDVQIEVLQTRLRQEGLEFIEKKEGSNE